MGNLYNEGIIQTVPPVRDAQGIFDSGDCVEPVASRNRHSFFPYSLSVSALDVLESQSGGNAQICWKLVLIVMMQYILVM